MNHFLGTILILLFTLNSQADLLDRVQLEEAVRSRLEHALQVKDPNVRVLIRFDYKSFKQELPGTNMLETQEFSPSKIEASDIVGARVEIYTELAELPEDVKESLYKIIPVAKNKIILTSKQTQSLARNAKKPVEASDLSQIATQSIESLAKMLFAMVAGTLLLTMSVLMYYSSRKMKEFREQFNILAKAISEGSSQSMMPYIDKAQKNESTQALSHRDIASFEKIPFISLREVFADLYWCEEDGYAHWLWKHLNSDQKTALLSDLPFMSAYSLYFVHVEEQAKRLHEHPFYLNPNSCTHLSMEVINDVISKDLSLWHQLSPIRQSKIHMSLETKLQAIQSRPTKAYDYSQFKASELRPLKNQANWGSVSFEDEVLLFTKPDMIPDAMRVNIRSLVWLAQMPDDQIQKTLSRYDARSLASAWVAPIEVLQKLEKQLPEKKLKLLQTYKEKSLPSRQSPVYQALVDEGLKLHAA